MSSYNHEDEPRSNLKRSYSELKITGPPLYSQGNVSAEETSHYCEKTDAMPIDATRTALLIVDVQPEYWSECPAVRRDFPHFPDRLNSLIQHCRDQSAKCIWVRADYSYEKSPWLQQFSRLHEGRIPPIVTPSTKWEEFAEPEQGEFVMTKTSWSSTSKTQLLDVLRKSGIDTVLVCGLITSVCVQHSAFGVFEAGFRTIIVSDCCADRGKQRHEAALALYGGYMYELRDVTSVKEELRLTAAQRAELVAKSVVKAEKKLCLSSGSSSTGSLSTMATTASDDESENIDESHGEVAVALEF